MLGSFGGTSSDRVAIDSMISLLAILGDREATGEALANLATAIDKNTALLAEVKAAQADVLAREDAADVAEEQINRDRANLKQEWDQLTTRRQELTAAEVTHSTNVDAHKANVEASTADLAAREAALKTASDAFDQYKSETERGLTQREVAISARESAMTDRENVLAQKAADLEARQKALRDLVA